MVGFLYGGNTGLTYQDLQSRREAADALAKRIMGSQPKNVPEGIGALLMGAASGIGRYRADKGLSEGRAAASTQFDSILGRILGSDSAGSSGTAGAPATTAFGAEMPKSGVATEMAATSPAKNFTYDPTIKSGITETASALGIDPVDLATAISYETGGTFDPAKGGPRTQWGRHKGLIQFGEPQAQKYGVDWENPVGSQLGADGAVAKYLRDTGVKPGMGLLDIYSAINAGGVGRYNASDANNGGAPGNVRDKVEKQMGGHRAKALAMFAAQAEADPQAAIDAIAPPSGAVMPPAAPQASAYVDPMVSAPNYQQPANQMTPPQSQLQNPSQAASMPLQNPAQPGSMPLPQQEASALSPLPSRDVSAAPPVASAPPQQIAQAAPAQIPRAQGYRPDPEMLKLLSNPFLDEGQKGALRLVMQQQMQEAAAAQEQQTWQARQDYQDAKKRNDPNYQVELDLNRARLDATRNKAGSRNVINVGGGVLYDVDNDKVITPKGDMPSTGNGFRFAGTSVEAQALNGLIESNQLTVWQAQQLAAGKTVTGPNGETLFMTPQGIFSQPGAGGQSQVQPAAPEIDIFAGTPMANGGSVAPAPPTAGTPAAPSPGGVGAITLSGPKAPNEGQANAGGFADRMRNADTTVAQFENQGSDFWQQLGSKMPGGNYTVTPEFQRYDRAKRDFVNAQLRRESGAVIGDSEFANAEKQYFPQPGDSPAVIEDKRRARQLALSGMTRSAGAGYKPIDLPATPSPPAGDGEAPEGVPADLWSVMTPEERALWQK